MSESNPKSMNKKTIRRKIELTDWYTQGAAVKPLYISYPWYTCSLMKILGKKIPLKYDIIINIRQAFMDDYISKQSLERVARYYSGRQKKNVKFILQLFENWHRKFVAPFRRLTRNYLKDDLKKYSNHGLLKVFRKYTQAYLAVWHEAIFLDGFDYTGEIILEEAIRKEKKLIEKNDLEILLAPPSSSYLQKERLDILRLAERSRAKKLSRGESAKYFRELSDEYYWLQNDLAEVHFLGPDHFSKKVSEILRSEKKLREEREMESWLAKLADKKRKIIKKYRLSPSFVNIAKFLALLGNFRDGRKSYNQMAGSTLRKFAEEFSHRSKLDIETVEYMFFWEIEDIFSLSEKRAAEIKSRKNGWLYFITGPDKFFALKGAEAAKANAHLKDQISQNVELKGMPAYAGIVEGTVKIIKDQKDFHKMEKGDILVSPNTRPEFMPVLKIAGAIVTDEGGMTCHAAIVSRELRIPCIVGMQGATSVLKDGDQVEVDAIKGSVKII